MKRLYSYLFILLIGTSYLYSSPVDFSMAQLAANKFAETKFAIESRNASSELVYTGPEGAFYVFNIGDKGFVIIAADDAHRPVIGYSNQGTFDENNIPPALMDYFDGVASSINSLRVKGNATATPLVAAEWESLLTTGTLLSRNGGRGVDYLVQTQWDQSYPYNYFCPEDPDGSHGHAIVGCLATSMAQLVSFWKNPEHGYGSHCYYHEDYGEICADFENTYYDWDHIANTVTANSPIEEIEAAALISFHCGVTIDMGYGPDGSGGASGPIPGAMHTYFNYSEANIQLRRNDFETEIWKTMVREQFDMGWPMYYGGCDDGCHAFICDGYDDYDMFHFNLGWGGSSDGWYLIDDAPYTNPADAMFNFVPSEVYNQTPSAPTSFTVTPVSDTELKTTISWTNPSTSLDGTPLTSIEEVVVLRDNAIIQTLTNVTPGAPMVIEDADVPRYDVYHYAVYVKANDRYGKHADEMNVSVGPSCTWKVVMQSSNLNGWNGGRITVYNNAGHEDGHCTLESNTPTAFQIDLPLGNLSFGWTAPNETVNNIAFNIKDSSNNTVYSFSGSSDALDEGIFCVANNGCGNEMICDVPQNVVATSDGGHVELTWDALENPGYGYNVYRDGILIRLLPSSTNFVDEEAPIGGHCYQLTVLCEGGESQPSNITWASEGPAYPPRNFYYELTSNFKIKLNWEPPVNTENFSGYYLYRRSEEGSYERIKLLNASAVTFIDNSSLEEGSYYYQLYAYYFTWDCTSSPANVKYQPNVFELHAYYSPTNVNETESKLEIAPNPTNGTVTVTAANLQEVEVYNVVGQQVISQKADSNIMTLDLQNLPSGLYFVNVIDGNGSCCVRKLVKQ